MWEVPEDLIPKIIIEATHVRRGDSRARERLTVPKGQAPQGRLVTITRADRDLVLLLRIRIAGRRLWSTRRRLGGHFQDFAPAERNSGRSKKLLETLEWIIDHDV